MERPGEPHVPEPELFDPGLSPVPSLPGADDGEALVVLLAAAAGCEDGWAERAAAGLASGWTEQGRPVLLADLALERPRLERVVGVALGEGVSDALLFGSSIERIAQRSPDGRFLFLSAGTATARPEAVASSGRWAGVAKDCARQGATLVVFLPAELPGGEALLARASDVLLLAGSAGDRDGAFERGLGPRLRAVLLPPGGAAGVEREEAPGGGARADGQGTEQAVAEVGGDLEGGKSAAAPSAAGRPPPPAGALEEDKAPARPEGSPRPRRISVLPEPTPSLLQGRRAVAITTLAAAGAAALAALAWLEIIQVPGLSEWLATFR